MKFNRLTRTHRTLFAQRRGNALAVAQEMLHRERHLKDVEHAVSHLLEDHPLAFIRAARSPRAPSDA